MAAPILRATSAFRGVPAKVALGGKQRGRKNRGAEAQLVHVGGKTIQFAQLIERLEAIASNKGIATSSKDATNSSEHYY